MAEVTGSPEVADDPDVADRFGICQWFHYEDWQLLEVTVRTLEALGVRHLRTGVSWADYHRPRGRAWYDHQMEVLARADLDVLLSIWHTPPSISMEPALRSSAVPPVRPDDYAAFVGTVLESYGETFDAVELWNEPNNPYKWDHRYDADYALFAEMVIGGASRVREAGKTSVLGGVTLLDYDFIELMERRGVLAEMDVLGIHAFPGMWEPYASNWDHPSHWYGWEHRVGEMERASGLPVWVTETGLATYHPGGDRKDREARQEKRLVEALDAPAERVYWYTLFDLPPDRLAIEEAHGGPREEPEYHMGLIRSAAGFRVAGQEKPAYRALRRALARPTRVKSR